MRRLLRLLPLLVCIASCGTEIGERRSVLLITIDTIRADRLGCYGDGRSSTPNLDRLARSGIQFADATAVVPTTLASHATILTGLYPYQHGIPRNGFHLRADIKTIAEEARETGLHTAAFIGSFAVSSAFGLDRGFDTYDENFSIASSRIAGDQDRRGAGEVVDAALEWIEEIGGEPYFLWIHLYDPHFPYDPPRRYRRGLPSTAEANGSMAFLTELWNRRRIASPEMVRTIDGLYRDEIAHMDREIGRLLTSLSGEADAPSILVVGDHGESLTEHGVYFKHGGDVFDAALRVPLILSDPGRAEASLREDPVTTIDVYPTLRDLLGLTPSRSIEGQSLFAPPTSERSAYLEASMPWVAERAGEWFNRRKSKAVRKGRWKLMESAGGGARALFDLENDPGESRGRRGGIGAGAEAFQELSTILDDHIAETDKFDPEEIATPSEEVRERLRALGYTGR